MTMNPSTSDHRKTVLTILEGHQPADSEEMADVAFIRDFVKAHSDCFGKMNPRGHITGSAFVLDPSGRVLLTFHRKLQRWLQLGGHSDADEFDPARTAHREALEESGLDQLDFHPWFREQPIDIDVHLIPENPRDAAHYHLDFRYVFLAHKPDEIVCGEESSDLRWFPLSETISLGFDPALQRAIRKLADAHSSLKAKA